MYKLYEITDSGSGSSMSCVLIAQGTCNKLGKLINQYYNILTTRVSGSRARTIYAIYDVNDILVSATGPR